MTVSVDDTEGRTEGSVEEQTPRSGRDRRLGSFEDRILLVAVTAVIVPFVVATARAIHRGWTPIGDNAYFLVRSRDVLTSHHPLLGTWTSASNSTPSNFNNPGPLLFDLWAVPTKLFGGPGLAIGVASLNVAAVVGIAVVIRRRMGPIAATVTMLTTALLAWSMGSELLYDPWQPHSLLFPFLFFLVAAWAFAAGDLVLAPWALGAGSLVVQTHLSYLILIGAVSLWATAAHMWSRRQRLVDADRPPPRLRRVLVALAVVFTVCWGQTLVEQVTATGEGNLTRLAKYGASTGPTVGVRTGTRVVADTIVVPPFWLKPSFAEALPTDGGLDSQLDSVEPSFPVALGLLGSLAAGSVVLAAVAVRRQDLDAAAGLGTAVVALGTAVVTASSLPYGVFGAASHQVRWMWPVGAFMTSAILIAITRLVAPDQQVRRIGATLLTTAIAVVAVATLPTYNAGAGPAVDLPVVPTIRTMQARMGAFAGRGPILIDLTGVRFAEPYSGPVMAELQRRKIPFVFDSEVLVRQMGGSRRRTGPAQLLTLREGDAATTTPPGAERVVFVPGLTPDEDAERATLRARIVDHLVEDGITVTDGAELPGKLDDPSKLPRAGDQPGVEALIAYGAFSDLVDAGLIVDGGPWPEIYRRWLSLQHRWQTQTIGLFLSPAPTEPIR